MLALYVRLEAQWVDVEKGDDSCHEYPLFS